MKISSLIKKLESDSKFKGWKKNNKDYYLVHAFAMIEKGKEEEWQIGYYSKAKDRIVTFFMDKEIRKSHESEIFKNHTEITELKKEKIKKDFNEIIKLVTSFQNKNYKKEQPIKIFLILQNINKAQIWNITFITKTLNTLNVKIDAENGRIINHKLTHLMQFGRFEK